MTGEWFGLSWGHLGDLMRNTGNRTWRLYRLSIATLKTNAALSEKKQNPASSMDLCRPLCESFVLEAYRTQIKLHPHQHTQECANLGTYAQMRLPATLPKTSSTTGRLRRMVHNPHATCSSTASQIRASTPSRVAPPSLKRGRPPANAHPAPLPPASPPSPRP